MVECIAALDVWHARTHACMCASLPNSLSDDSERIEWHVHCVCAAKRLKSWTLLRRERAVNTHKKSGAGWVADVTLTHDRSSRGVGRKGETQHLHLSSNHRTQTDERVIEDPPTTLPSPPDTFQLAPSSRLLSLLTPSPRLRVRASATPPGVDTCRLPRGLCHDPTANAINVFHFTSTNGKIPTSLIFYPEN